GAFGSGASASADLSWIEEILRESGYVNARIEAVHRDLTIGRTVDDAMYLQGRIGPLARALAELDEKTAGAAKDAVRQALTEHHTEAGIVLGSATWIVHAENPG
ncbi:MAG: hypothetical protein AAGE43_08800, partial [Pseudomonadota bacterium]